MEDILSTQQITYWHDVFNSFDYESTGNIHCEDLPDLLKSIEQPYEEDDLEKYIKQIDTNNLGKINFSELLFILRKLIKDQEEAENDKEELKKAFKQYDKDGHGHIRVSDFREILRNLDNTQTEEELDDLINEFDTDGSGTIDLDEFLNATARK